MLGVAAGFMAQRFLWPRTAMQAFLQRSAGQLDLCVQAVRGENGVSGSRYLARLLSAYTKQLSLLLQTHQQASREPVERALDDARRAELLSLTQNLFDASVGARRWAIGNEAAAPQESAAALASLHEALTHQDETLVASLNAAAGALRGIGTAPDSGLGEARAAVDAQIDALRARADLARADDERLTSQLLARLAASRRLVESQLQLEVWLADWHRAQVTHPDAVLAPAG
jgi:hypothetical protein